MKAGQMIVLPFLAVVQIVFAGTNDKIHLSSVKALTLEYGRITNARRNSPIQQLTCVGGSAGCMAFIPKTVQCYNRGSDGYDIQWECKTDMDNKYRFGKLEVSCEGYDYPEDPYILRGSCGLEYTIESTGKRERSSGYHNNFGSHNSKREHNGFGYLILVGIVFIFIYGVYKYCLATTHTNVPYDSGHPTTDQVPPPPGFRPEYIPDSCNTGQSAFRNFQGSNATGFQPGFWSGAATGGLFGYLFGRQGQSSCRTSPFGHQPTTDWFGTQTSYGSDSSHDSPGSRTTSGFGGTKRR